MADLNFNANDHEPAQEFAPIPEGEYLAVITASEMKETSKKTGHYLALTFQVIEEGPAKGRNLWANLNLDNPNDKAVKIAQAELSAICRAVGVMTPRQSEELHDKPLRIKVKVTKRNDNGELTNKISKFSPASEAPAAAPAASGGSPWGAK